MDIGAPQILSFVFIMFSIILHEIAHGYAALKFGDETAKVNDRLTINPIPHIDPIGTILVPAIQLLIPPHQVYLGWAKPVPVNPLNLEPRTAGEIVVAIAGVTVNLAIAAAMAIVLGFFPRLRMDAPLFEVVFTVLAVNVGLAIFNLLPIPPLDGSHVLEKILPYHLRASYRQIGFYGIFIILMLSSRGLLSRITGPPIEAIVNFLFLHVTIPVYQLVHGRT